MKFRLAPFLIPVLMIVSCSKSRTCTCSDESIFYVKGSKKQTKQACEKYNTESVTCEVN